MKQFLFVLCLLTVLVKLDGYSGPHHFKGNCTIIEKSKGELLLKIYWVPRGLTDNNPECKHPEKYNNLVGVVPMRNVDYYEID